jgi:hypothetical protein
MLKSKWGGNNFFADLETNKKIFGFHKLGGVLIFLQYTFLDIILLKDTAMEPLILG